MIDPEKIKLRFDIIRENVRELEKLKKLSLQQLSDNKRDLAATKHFIRVAIEAMIDIATHIVVKKLLSAPATATDAMNLLSEKNVITKQNAETYVRMVKYRNRLVHFYHELTVSEIFDIIQKKLGDFNLFIKDISLFIKNIEE